MKSTVIVMLSLLVVDCMSSLTQGQDQLERDSSPRLPKMSLSVSPFSVSVNGDSLPVNQGTRQQITYFTRFRYSHPVEITVEYEKRVDQQVALHPECHKGDLRFEGRRLSIIVDDLRPRVLQVDGLPYLFIFPEPTPKVPDDVDSSVIVIPPNDNAAQHSSVLQAALDQAYHSKGGSVVLEPGVHQSRALRLRSHTTLYLKQGAILQGTGVPDDYMTRHGRRALILIDRATDAAIRGLGVIDGLGHILQQEHNAKAHLIDAIACRRVNLEGLVLQDPGGWAVHLLGCENVAISRIKILGDWALANTDGIDPDMSENVMIEDCFIHSGDDSIVVKTTGSLGLKRPSKNIVVRRCVLMTKKTSLKIGTESRYDIQDVLFEDIDVVNSSRGCALWMRDGSVYSNITFRNIRMPNLMRFPNEKWSGEAYHISLQERYGQGRMENILFEGVKARSEQRSSLFSKLDYPLEGITFKDCVWSAKEGELIPPIKVENAYNISLINCKIETAGKVKGFPADLVVGPSKNSVAIE